MFSRNRLYGVTVFSALLVGFLLVSLKPPSSQDVGTEEPAGAVSVLPDFTEYTNVKEKKRAFFNFLLPLIQRVNNDVAAQRHQLQPLALKLERGGSLSEREQDKLNNLAEYYEIKTAGLDDWQLLQKLLHRIDIVPVSLVLSQSANESAWGTSRFARDGNNLFGMWCFTPGCGMVPHSRVQGASHEVAVFNSPDEAVTEYIRTLNTHPAYREFRDLRTLMRENDEVLSGFDLAEGLLQYSARGEDYIEELREMIRINKLSRFDQPQP